MKKIVAACGNDCSQCPRHLPKSEADLRHTAELWKKIGYRDRVVSNKEISCSGCVMGNWCRYEIIGCTTERNIQNCGQCGNYPCKKIEECFELTKSFMPSCRAVCDDLEYQSLEKAFFEKKLNLDLAANGKKK